MLRNRVIVQNAEVFVQDSIIVQSLNFRNIYIVKPTLRIVSFTFTMTLTKNNLRSFREKEGLSQEKLADKVSVTRQTIISIEGGRYVPSLELALKFAKLFKCKVEDMFGV